MFYAFNNIKNDELVIGRNRHVNKTMKNHFCNRGVVISPIEIHMWKIEEFGSNIDLGNQLSRNLEVQK